MTPAVVRSFLDQPVVVTWRDIEATPGWVSKKKLASVESPVCLTIGYLVRVSREDAVLASTQQVREPLEWGDVNTIPLGAITEIQRVRIVRSR